MPLPSRLTSALRAMALLLLASQPLASAAETPADIATLRQQALDLVNESRREAGLGALTLGTDAVEAAQAHADDMFARDYYAHESPEGETVQDRYIAAGGSRWQLVAENIARCEGCTPPATADLVAELQRGWMNSPGHRRNILSPGLATFGYGLTIGADQGLYAVQTFAGPGEPRGLNPGEAPTALQPDAQADRALAAVNRLRGSQDLPGLQLAPALNQAAATLLPPPQDEALTLGGDLYAALPEGERQSWASLAVIAGACGGCGAQPVAADIRDFVQDWRDDPSYRARLLDPKATAMGFAMRADGEGRKTAVLTVGQAR